MAYADDKLIRATQQVEPFSELHVGGHMNILDITAFDLPSTHPSGPLRHKVVTFFGFQAPGSDYPDSIAPIGSKYVQFTVAGGAVTACRTLTKTAAATWTVDGSIA